MKSEFFGDLGDLTMKQNENNPEREFFLETLIELIEMQEKLHTNNFAFLNYLVGMALLEMKEEISKHENNFND